MGAEKIKKLNKDSVYEDIVLYLNELEINSHNTRNIYEKAIKEFFEYFNLDYKFLKEDDLKFSRKDVMEYRQHLIKKGLKSNSINPKMAAIRGLFDRFLVNEYKINSNIFKFKQLKRHDAKSYGELSHTEGLRFAEAVFETERNKKFTKHVLILFAIYTSFRLDEILRLKWSDYQLINGFHTFGTLGKGKKENRTSIGNKLYEKIILLKDHDENRNWKGDQSLVFKISLDSINDMMNRLREYLGIEKDRNIVFHSFRGIAIDWQLENGDIKQAALQGNHSSIDTTWRHYINKNKDYSLSAGIRMEEEVDLEFLNDLSVEDFKEFFNQGSYKLKMEIKEYINKNKLTIEK